MVKIRQTIICYIKLYVYNLWNILIEQKKYSVWELNPRPPACQADVITPTLTEQSAAPDRHIWTQIETMMTQKGIRPRHRYNGCRCGPSECLGVSALGVHLGRCWIRLFGQQTESHIADCISHSLCMQVCTALIFLSCLGVNLYFSFIKPSNLMSSNLVSSHRAPSHRTLANTEHGQ